MDAIGRVPVDRGLRPAQGPLKQRYTEQPSSTIVNCTRPGASANASPVQSGRDETGDRGGRTAPGIGRRRVAAVLGDMLLEALAACADVTLRSVATSSDIPIRGGRARVRGISTSAGPLAVATDAPVDFVTIRLRFELETDATEDHLDARLHSKELLRAAPDAGTLAHLERYTRRPLIMPRPLRSQKTR